MEDRAQVAWQMTLMYKLGKKHPSDGWRKQCPALPSPVAPASASSPRRAAPCAGRYERIHGREVKTAAKKHTKRNKKKVAKKVLPAATSVGCAPLQAPPPAAAGR